MTITVTVKLDPFRRRLATLKDQAKFATVLALTKTAKAAQKDLKQTMATLFEAPSKFTLNSIYVTAATKSSMQSTVGVKGGALSWLRTEIYGGERKRAIEKTLASVGLPPSGLWAIPASGAQLTTGRHVSLPWLRRVVRQLAVGNLGNINLGGKRRRVIAGAAQVFAIVDRHRLKPGIYSKQGGRITPLILFVKPPHYRAKFDFFGIGERSVRENFPAAFDEAVAQVIRTSR